MKSEALMEHWFTAWNGLDSSIVNLPVNAPVRSSEASSCGVCGVGIGVSSE